MPKFRVWDKQGKIMLESSSGGMFLFLNGSAGEKVCNSIFPSINIDNDRFVLMKYAGLKDIEGVEICEGDILKFENGKIRTVFRVKGGFAVESLDCDVGKYDESFCCPIEGLSYEQTAGYIESHAKVIGDIYRNPELLD